MARFISRFNRAVLWMSLLVAVGVVKVEAVMPCRDCGKALDKLDEIWPGLGIIVIAGAAALCVGSLFWFKRGGSKR